LSFSSNTTRSAVFLPMPGMQVRVAWSPPRIAVTRRSVSIPLSTVIASLANAGDGQQLLEQPLLVRLGEPKQAIWSSRTWV